MYLNLTRPGRKRGTTMTQEEIRNRLLELRHHYADDEDAIGLIDMYLNSKDDITERQLADTMMALDVACGPEGVINHESGVNSEH